MQAEIEGLRATLASLPDPVPTSPEVQRMMSRIESIDKELDAANLRAAEIGKVLNELAIFGDRHVRKAASRLRAAVGGAEQAEIQALQSELIRAMRTSVGNES